MVLLVFKHFEVVSQSYNFRIVYEVKVMGRIRSH